jgi:glycosyltransferase involved in cell wall biosynthesis
LIVDDGSTDDTESLVAIWQKDKNFFSIRYRWKPNGGKHTAHNLGLSLARGEYFSILDSDDWYAPDTLKFLIDQWNSISDEMRSQFSNVEGICCNKNGKIIGRLFPQEVYDSNILTVQLLNDKPADTMGMHRLEVLREFPFPDNFDGCYVPEGLVWERIADRYNTRFTNFIVGYKEYLVEGLTKRSTRAVLARSRPLVLYNREMSLRKSVSVVKRFKCKANVYRYSFHNRMSVIKELKEENIGLFGIPFVIIGLLAYLKDRMTILKEELAGPSS